MRYILLSILIIVLLTSIYYKAGDREYFDNAVNKDEENKKKYMEALDEVRPAPQVQPGPQGARGPSGPSGGAYQDRGSLMNLGHTGMRLDRYFGTQVSAFLTDPNYRSHQNWTLQSDGQVANQYGGCLAMDPKTEQVFVSKCSSENPSADQMWIYDQYGRFVSKADNNVCLEVNSQIKSVTGRGGGLIDDNKGSGKGTPENTPMLTVGQCGMNNAQMWHFD